jgi:hypothetical protein
MTRSGAGRGERPHRTIPFGATLSVDRAFVVHFARPAASGRRRFVGRVEHLSTGEFARFSSLSALLEFFARVDGA